MRVVGAFATMGVIAGSDLIVAEFNAKLAEGEPQLGQIHMFIGAMIMGPLGGLRHEAPRRAVGRQDQGRASRCSSTCSRRALTAFVMSIVGFFVLAPIVNKIMDGAGNIVETLVDNNLLPLTSVLIEPAKVFFLNNAINHGVLTPLGIQEATEQGKSVLFLLEANPGPGLGLLLAFTFFGTGSRQGDRARCGASSTSSAASTRSTSRTC